MSIPSPLHDLHAAAHAEFQPYGDVEIVSTFGAPQAEYAAARKACALMDLPQRGVLSVTGNDRLAFLNNLLTNQTVGLAQGQGVYAFLLNNKGRIITDVNVLERGKLTLLEMDARMLKPVREILAKYIFREDVRLDDVSGMYEFALHGPTAPAVLEQLGVPLPPPGLLASSEASLWDMPVILWRDDPAAVPGYGLILPAENAPALWQSLTAQVAAPVALGKRPLRPMGWAAFNAVRIEGGRPIFGIDFTDAVLPAETGQLDRAVSLTKGCYLGQEIVARMHARQQLSRQLVGIRMENDALPIAGSPIYDAQQNQIGAVTSSTLSPVLSNIAICLGYLKKPFFAHGTAVVIPAEGAMHNGRVVKTPFLPAPVDKE